MGLCCYILHNVFIQQEYFEDFRVNLWWCQSWGRIFLFYKKYKAGFGYCSLGWVCPCNTGGKLSHWVDIFNSGGPCDLGLNLKSLVFSLFWRWIYSWATLNPLKKRRETEVFKSPWGEKEQKMEVSQVKTLRLVFRFPSNELLNFKGTWALLKSWMCIWRVCIFVTYVKTLQFQELYIFVRVNQGLPLPVRNRALQEPNNITQLH